MNSIKKLSLIAIAVAGLTACDSKKEETITFENDSQKEAYSLGASIGDYMAKQLKDQDDLGLELDQALIVKGFEQGISGNPQLTKDERDEILKNLDKKAAEKRKEKDSVAAQANLEKGNAFLEKNKSKDGVKVTNSGLQYEVMSESKGPKPRVDDIVEVHYRGTLIDGTVFDSSYERGTPAKFPLSRVIPGWSEGVQLMAKGSKYRFVIPADLAYGENGAGDIPANSTLIFEVELLSIEKTAAVKNKKGAAQLKAEVKAK